MKRALLLCILTLLIVSLFAQDKASLTKEETAKYINKKMDEVSNQWITEKDNVREYITGVYVGIKDCNLEIKSSRKNKAPDNNINCGDREIGAAYDFNPAHIVEITDYILPTNQPLGYIKIKLISTTGKLHSTLTEVVLVTNPQRYDYNRCNYSKEIYNKRESCQYVYIPYLKSDPTNFNKLKKAFEYLRDLCKAEDDPFGE